MEEINKIVFSCEDKMKKALEHLEKELKSIRAGKASPSVLEGIVVDYYGTPTDISQVANIATTDSKTITIQPWEKNMLEPIAKSIMESDLGFNPMNNGENLIISIPPLTEERRIQLAKQAKTEVENGKVAIRNIRKEGNNDIKKMKDKGVSDDMIKTNEE